MPSKCGPYQRVYKVETGDESDAPEEDLSLGKSTASEEDGTSESDAGKSPENDESLNNVGQKEVALTVQKHKGTGEETSLQDPTGQMQKGKGEETSSQDPADKEQEEKCKDASLYEELIKDLQQGCAYLTKKELRRVCDKYQAYESVRETSTSDSDCDKYKAYGLVVEPSGADSQDYVFSGCLGTTASSSRHEETSDATDDYSGSLGPCTSGVACAVKTDTAAREHRGRNRSPFPVQETTQVVGDKRNTAVEYALGTWHMDQGKRLHTQHTHTDSTVQPERQHGGGANTKGKKATASTAGATGGWQPRSSSSQEIVIVTNRPSLDQPSRGKSNTHRNFNKSNSNSILETAASWPEPSERDTFEEGFEKPYFNNKSNSNSVCLSELRGPDCAEEAVAVTDSATSGDQNGQCAAQVVDELWFDCWEADFSPVHNSERLSDGCSLEEDFTQHTEFLQNHSPPLLSKFDVFISTDYCDWEDGVNPCQGKTAPAKHQGGIVFPMNEVSGTGLSDNLVSCNTGASLWSHSRVEAQKVIYKTHTENSAKSAILESDSGSLIEQTSEMVRRVPGAPHENTNSNADSLMHLKKQLSKQKLLSQSSSRASNNLMAVASETQTFSPKAEQGTTDTKPNQVEGQTQNIPGQMQFDINTLREIGLVPSRVTIDPAVALSMGLSAEQVRHLISSSVQVGEASPRNLNTANIQGQREDEQAKPQDEQVTPFDQELARKFGLTSNQIKQLAQSFAHAIQNPPVGFDRDLARKIGLSEDQVQLLAYSSAQRTLRQRLFDPELARQMGLTAEQIHQLADSSSQASRCVLDVVLAKKMGLSDSQVQELLDSPLPASQPMYGSSSNSDQQPFDIATALALGLRPDEIAQLLESSAHDRSNPGYPNADSLNVKRRYTHGMCSSSGRSYHPKTAKKSRPGSYQHHANAARNGPEQTRRQNYPDRNNGGYQAVGDGTSKKNSSVRKRQLVAKLRANVSDGDKVNDVLTTLVEWNSILLVVIFLLLVTISCPGVARTVLPCPLPSACQVLNQYVLAPFGLDQILTAPDVSPKSEAPTSWTSRLWGGAEGCESTDPPVGIVYTMLYRFYKTATRTTCDAFSCMLNSVILPTVCLPVKLLGPVLATVYTSAKCTLSNLLYLGFYASGSLLGLNVPRSLAVLREESHAGTYAASKVSTTGKSGSADTADREKWLPPWTDKPSRGEGHVQSGQKGGSQGQPFTPDQVEPKAPDLQNLHQHGGFLFYIGFDPPKTGCKYSRLSSFFLWLLWSLPQECA